MLELTILCAMCAIGLAGIGAFVGAIAVSELLLVVAGSAFAVLVSDLFGEV